MERRSLMTVAVVVTLLLAGCSGLDSSGNTSTTAATTTTTQTTEPTTTTTSTSTTSTSTTESWSKPAAPNKPLQNKMDEEDRDRMKSVQTESRAGGGFDLTVTADTRMEDVDPADHGTVVGEPYFLVYAGGSLDNKSRFSYVNGTLAERSSEVTQKENGEYTLEVDSEALEKANVEEGKVEVLVLLMDKDSDWDDIYGVRKVTVEYSSGK
ncbi:hypothetical protein [Halomicrococcus sp. NG-SE-24]|uniref:hypothetical protein n=1 Tax=Halomicrococcus sp. NG-SE-24 TaxID=3436928 RepID=UPI003D98F5A7